MTVSSPKANEGDTSAKGASVKVEKSLKKVSERNFLTAILNFKLSVKSSLIKVA